MSKTNDLTVVSESRDYQGEDQGHIMAIPHESSILSKRGIHDHNYLGEHNNALASAEEYHS